MHMIDVMYGALHALTTLELEVLSQASISSCSQHCSATQPSPFNDVYELNKITVCLPLLSHW